MAMTNVDTVSTYFASHSVGGGNMVTTGALDSGSITSGFGTIDTGSSNITTTGTVSTGNLTVTGTTTTVNSTVMTVVDPIINLQTASGGGAIASDTNKDVGLAMHYHTGSAAKIAFLGYDDSAGKLTFVTDATLSSEVVSGTAGTIVADLEGTVQTATQGSITSLGTLTTLTVDNVIINGTTIGHTSDTDLMTVASGILTVAGEISVTTLDIGGTNITSTAAELNIMDGVTTTAAELNLIDGGTARGTTAVVSGDGVLINDDGTMRMTNVDTLDTYYAAKATTLTNKTLTSAVLNTSISGSAISVTAGSTSITTAASAIAINTQILDTPTGFITLVISGTSYKIPYYAA